MDDGDTRSFYPRVKPSHPKKRHCVFDFAHEIKMLFFNFIDFDIDIDINISLINE